MMRQVATFIRYPASVAASSLNSLTHVTVGVRHEDAYLREKIFVPE